MLGKALHRDVWRAVALVSAIALLGALFAGCGQHGPTLPSPDGTAPPPPPPPQNQSTANWGPQLPQGAPIPCPVAVADVVLYEGPADTGPWDQRQIVSWNDNRRCAGGGGQNADVALVLDASGSMSAAFGNTTRIEALKDAAKQLVSLMGADDRADVIQFGCSSDNSVVQDFTSDQSALNAAIDGLSAQYGCTAAWDGGKLGLDELIAKGRSGVGLAVVLVTDGGDNDSAISVQALIQAATTAGIPIYTVGVADSADPNLEQIAADTGGSFAQADDPAALSAAFQQIFEAVVGGDARVVWATAYQPGDQIWVRIVYKEGTADEYTIGPFQVTIKAPTP
jgi:Mg-chelatase subunit ChlD/predicted small lipoprotein YifL